MNLLQPSRTFADKLINILAGYSAMLFWFVIFSNLLSFTYNYRSDIILAQFYTQRPSQLFIFIMSVILAPLWEELVFRHSVIQIAKNNKQYIIWVVIIISAIFGSLHNNPEYYYGIYFQGVFGFIFACVYIKNGYHYWSSVILHAMWNGTVFALPYLM